MNAEETLAYLDNLQDVTLGIPEPLDLSRKPPIVLRKMNRTHLAKLFGRLGFKVGAEIGVSRGAYSHRLWQETGATIYSIDPWEAYDGYAEPYTQEQMDMLYAQAKRRLANTGCLILRKFSGRALANVHDGELDFVFIDANHEFRHVVFDIAEWSKKVRDGGIISGHDYARYKNHAPCHVKEVVNAWTYSHKIAPWFVAKARGGSTWWWVNQC